MKYKNTKKCECAHFYYGPRYLVTDDPYPIYNNDNYCKIGRFDWTWEGAGEHYPCEKCKGFKVNRDKVRKRWTEIKEEKKRRSEYRKYDKYLLDHPEEREVFGYSLNKIDL